MGGSIAVAAHPIVASHSHPHATPLLFPLTLTIEGRGDALQCDIGEVSPLSFLGTVPHSPHLFTDLGNTIVIRGLLFATARLVFVAFVVVSFWFPVCRKKSIDSCQLCLHYPHNRMV